MSAQGDTLPAAASKRRIRGLEVTGFCAPGSPTHGCCPGAVRNGNGSLILCECGDCEHSPTCLDCRSEDEIDPKTWTCLDKSGCEVRVQARLLANPLLSQIRAAVEAGERARQERADQISAMAPGEGISQTRTVRISSEPRRTRVRSETKISSSGKCLCGCGGATSKRFCPGHDSRHRSNLIRQARSGSTEALDQIRDLGWSHHVPSDVSAKIQTK